ncbi:hypothetical protein PBT90_15595 [Algoriphagus halophytocola]|uniref:Lipocalin-like domain-containing protein n=1 Tax=Algoriphagus halophytocola TaxID=2991499 RepID=A0ABY6MDN0_9BACT|nr:MULTISPECIES: hypothetical protein [unclassified Algoriphagus]UZD20995.1 hypothetical protein OM944_09930 [Algoriphagus sp. TR-M5]WBL42161.1 hypothetical protein PBT90_15595 [Algoriphagus sp. TR-M9]
MIRILTLALLVTGLLISCDDPTDCNGFRLGQEFEIPMDEPISNCPENISITLFEIQDSRCPIGAQCIWSGMISISGELTINGKEYDLNLSSYETVSGFPESFSTTDYTVKLVDAVPFPDITKTTKEGEKRAILLITRRST